MTRRTYRPRELCSWRKI